MNTNILFTVVIILALVIGAGAVFYYYKKRNLEKFFNQIYEEAKQVPKQKKNSFLLLMFKESVSASKNKSNSSTLASKLKNPKYLNIQLVQMSRILKDTSNVEDKTIKKALNLLKVYQTWEKEKIAKNKKAVESKAS